jgi:hypothetical protein
MECRHLDGNRTNNRLENLRWGTSQENAEDRHRHGTAAAGSRNSLAKLTEEKVIEIRKKHAVGMTCLELGRIYGVHQSAIYQACSGHTWKHVPSGPPYG